MPKITFNASSEIDSSRGTKQVYSAATKQNPSSMDYAPWVSTNPYTNTEYQYFEDAWSSGVGGEALDTAIDFAWGKGIKLRLELIEKGELNEEQQAEKLKPYNAILEKIRAVDERPNVQANESFKAAARLSKVFGRTAIGFEPSGDIVSNVDVLKLFHPRDLGRVWIKDYDWSVSTVMINLFQKNKMTVAAEDMIYIVNDKNNPIRRNVGYGFSEFHRIVGASRSMRRFVEYDSPEIVQSMWASYGMFIIRPQSKSPSTDANAVLGGLRAGGFNAVVANPEDVVYNNVKLDAEVEKMSSLMNFFERMIIGNFKVPAPLLGREEEANMATLFGKIRLFVAGPVQDIRNWIAPILEQQWYNRMLAEFDKNAAKVVRVKVDFEPLLIESWADVVDALGTLKEKVLPEMPMEMILKLANLEAFKPMIDAEVKKRQEMQDAQDMANPQEDQTDPNEGADTANEDTANIIQQKAKPFQADVDKRLDRIERLAKMLQELE